MPEHPVAASTFEAEIVRLLSSCLEQQHSNPRVTREKMWSAYHTLRVSHEYKAAWSFFLAQSGSSVLPLFHQHVGHSEEVRQDHVT